MDALSSGSVLLEKEMGDGDGHGDGDGDGDGDGVQVSLYPVSEVEVQMWSQLRRTRLSTLISSQVILTTDADGGAWEYKYIHYCTILCPGSSR